MQQHGAFYAIPEQEQFDLEGVRHRSGFLARFQDHVDGKPEFVQVDKIVLFKYIVDAGHRVVVLPGFQVSGAGQVSRGALGRGI